MTKTSQKVRVDKYFNNAIYDVIRMEWFSLSLKIHPMCELILLPKLINVPFMKRHKLREILETTNYIRVLCSTNGMIYTSSGPSLKERGKYGTELPARPLGNSTQEGGELSPDTRTTAGLPIPSLRPNTPYARRAILPTDRPSISEARETTFIRIPSLNRQQADVHSEGSYLKSFKQ